MRSCWQCAGELAPDSRECPHCRAVQSGQAINDMATIVGAGAPTEIAVGMKVRNRYHIVRELGRGGMGIVFFARDTLQGEDVALKVIPRALSEDPNASKALSQETSIARKLRHPHIVGLYHFDTWAGRAFTVMEYVGGGTLSHFRANAGGRCTLEAILPYLHQIASALDYSHQADPPVLHRDLKPANVLMSVDGKSAKLADYGLARVLLDTATRVSGHDSAGTLAYMAPEQLRGKGIGRGTDIYAFAALIYELLAGHPPFFTGDLRWQIIHEQPEPIPDLPPSQNDALLAGLAKNSADRPESAGELLALLVKNSQAPAPQILPKTASSVQEEMDRRMPAPTEAAPLPIANPEPAPGSQQSPGGPVFETPDKAEEVAAGKVLPGVGSVEVVSSPPGATVCLDGKSLAITPCVLGDIAAGEHRLEVELAGHESWSQAVVIVPGQAQRLTARLGYRYGVVTVTSTPEGAEFLVDGCRLGTTPFTGEVERGKRDLALALPGYQEWRKLARIPERDEVFFHADLSPALGRLRLTSTPSGAEVVACGGRLGQTPLDCELAAGEVEVELRLDMHRPESVRVVLVSGATEEREVRLHLADSLLDPTTGMEFVLVPGGSFAMGDIFGDGNRDELPVHEVTIDAFYLGRYPVTIEEYRKIVAASGEARGDTGDDARQPVEGISWNEAQDYIGKLGAVGGRAYRLPSEAEWEYAARSGGRDERYAGGDDVDALAWHLGNSDRRVHPVGGKRANGLGLADMSGNVWEWCRDWYDRDAYRHSSRTNPSGPASGFSRVLRGGASTSEAWLLRTTLRNNAPPIQREAGFGFRLALSLPK